MTRAASRARSVIPHSPRGRRLWYGRPTVPRSDPARRRSSNRVRTEASAVRLREQNHCSLLANDSN
eukprot:30937-Pelagococcus_subviridis.AAC.4